MRHFRVLVSMSLALCLLVLGGFVLTAYAQAPISGRVFPPPGVGFPLPGSTVVKLYEPGSETLVGQAVPNLNTGNFSFPDVPRGAYVLVASAPDSDYTPSRPKPVVVIDKPITNVPLVLTYPQVYGTVHAPDGTPAEARVAVYKRHMKVQQTTTSNGQFLVGGLLPGTYGFQASPVGDDPYWHSVPVTMEVPASPITRTAVLTLTNADLWGSARDSLGNPVAGAPIIAINRSGGTHRRDVSGVSGAWAIGDLADGDYLVAGLRPHDRPELLLPVPFAVTLPGASNPYTITFEITHKVVSGTVSTNTGASVFHAQVTARRMDGRGRKDTLTAADGMYQLDLSPGMWALTVRTVTDTNPANWVYPGPPTLVYFTHTADPESHRADFTVITADASVSGAVAMPDGSTPPFTVTVALHNDEGVGLRTRTDPGNGSFQLNVPNGNYKVLVHPHNPGYLGPVVDPISVPPEGSVDLGTLTLLARNALITGTLTDSEGEGVAGVPVVTWREGVAGSRRTRSDPDGEYALPVTSGEWKVRPAPGPLHPYLYTGDPQVVTVAEEQVVPNVNFTLVSADATIEGLLVDTQGNPVNDAGGWITARDVVTPRIHSGAPISAGLFSLLVPGGTYNLIARLAPGGNYVSTGMRQVSVPAGGTTVVTLTVQAKDAAIAGALYDRRNQEVVNTVDGAMGAWHEYNWALAPIISGASRLDVAAGLWYLGYRIDPTAGYAKLAGPRAIPVESGKTAAVSLPVLRKDGVITGTVYAPNGSALGGALVLAKGFSGDVEHLWLKTLSRANGSFTLTVPYGDYRLGATVPNPDWIKPVEIAVTVPENGASGGHELRFRQSNATVNGTLTVSNTTHGGPVLVWAWSDDGGFTRRVFTVTQSGNQASGPYQLNVISGTTWHLGASFETGSQYWRGQASVTVDGSAVTQDLVLSGPNPKPGPVVVMFDAADEQYISLADGTEVFIPAGAMPTSGMVILRIVPMAAVPNQHNLNVYNYGYAFLASDESGLPIEDHFNQEVTVRFTYDEQELLQQGILENRLKPAYYSTTTDQWTFPEAYVVDTEANEVTMQIDHFTDFALLEAAAGGYSVHLPLIVR